MYLGMDLRFMGLLPRIRIFFKQHTMTYGKEQTFSSTADARSYFSDFIHHGSITR